MIDFDKASKVFCAALALAWGIVCVAWGLS